MKLGDKPRAYTAEDVIRRFNLNGLDNDRKSIQNLNNGLTKTNAITEEYVKSVLTGVSENLTKDQVDITTWFFTGTPTTSNEPAVDWTTAILKQNHLSDLYYDKNTGYAYKWVYDEDTTTYKWELVTDGDVITSLAIANAENDTEDFKRRLFVNTPTTPYEVGDVWISEDGLYRCRAKRESGNFNSVDWIDAGDYSDEDYLNNVVAVVNKYIITYSTDYVTKVLLETTKDAIYSNISATYTTKSEMTNYSTTTEMNNSITQQISDNNTNYVAVELNKKVDDTDVTGAYLILRINNDSSSGQLSADKVNITASDIITLLANNTIDITTNNLGINSTNFSLDYTGFIRAVSGLIGGFSLGQHLFTANLELNQTYGSNDVTRLQQIILGNVTPTQNDYDKYDLTKSGTFDITDLLIVQKLANGVITGDGTFSINTEESDDAITLTRDDGKVVINIGLFGAYFDNLKANTFNAETIKCDKVTAGNIDSGTCTLDSSAADVTVYFNKTFASVPKVVITPNTTVSGVIAPKVKSITTTYFTATIGGNIGQFSNVNCSWIAIG